MPPNLIGTTTATAAGKHAKLLGDLEADMRRVMQPNTAVNLKESKRNILKDFVSVAGPLGVSHFIMLTATQNSNYLRLTKVRHLANLCSCI